MIGICLHALMPFAVAEFQRGSTNVDQLHLNQVISYRHTFYILYMHMHTCYRRHDLGGIPVFIYIYGYLQRPWTAQLFLMIILLMFFIFFQRNQC